MKPIIIFLLLLTSFNLNATEIDSLNKPRQPYHKNIIKFNPTPMILWDWRNITFSYERILNPRQSISFELGYLVMPQLFADTMIDLVNITSRWRRGINLAIEYRFYLTQLSTRPVPAGLYLGPYLTFYGYKFENGLDILNPGETTNGMIKGNYWSFFLGLELGYQFVFKKRWTLDLVLFGPSMAYFGGKSEITGELSGEQIEDLNQEIYDKLVEKFPVVQTLSIDQTFQQSGKLDIFRMGFRYLVQVGYHF